MNTRKIGTIALAATALIALGCGAGDLDDPTKKDGQAGSSSSAGTTVTTSKAPAGKKYETLTPADIKLGVKILSKKCFGSAGCNVEFRITSLSFAKDLDPEATYEVTFAYKGLEDPLEARLTLNGSDGKYETEESEFASAKKSAKITAVVTGVEKM